MTARCITALGADEVVEGCVWGRVKGGPYCGAEVTHQVAWAVLTNGQVATTDLCAQHAATVTDKDLRIAGVARPTVVEL